MYPPLSFQTVSSNKEIISSPRIFSKEKPQKCLFVIETKHERKLARKK